MKNVACAWLCACLLAAPALRAEEAPIQADFRADIDRLLETTHAMELAGQMTELVTAQFLANLKQLRPDLPQAALDAVPQAVREVVAANSESLHAALVALYARHFTHADVRAMLDFYRTDIGRKTIEVMPKLMQDSMALGAQWGQSIAPQFGPKIAEKLRERGIDI